MRNTAIVVASFLALTFGSTTNVFSQWTHSAGAGGLNGGAMNCFVADGSIIYAGFGSTDDTIFGNSNGILYSTDHGESWTGLGESWNQLGMSPITSPVLTIAAQGSTMFAGGGSDLWRSTDSGSTWTKFQLRYGYQTLENLAMHGSNLFATTYNGLLRSTDSGLSWKVLTDSSYGPLAFIGSKIYAGSNYQGLLVSTDSGDDWKIVGMPFGTGVSSIAVSDSNIAAIIDAPAYWDLNYDTGQFVAFSSDSGHNWVETFIPNSVGGAGSMALKGQNLYTANFMQSAWSYQYYSKDKGKTWIQFPSESNQVGGPNLATCLLVSGDNFILCSGNSGIWYFPLSGLSSVIPTVNIQATLSIYPNPTTGLLHVVSNASDFVITDLLGRTWLHSVDGSHDLDVSGLLQGVYSISDGHSRAEFVKE